MNVLDPPVRIVAPTASQFAAIECLIVGAFSKSIADSYDDEGQTTFLAHVDAKVMAARVASGHLARVGLLGGRPVGYVEARPDGHLALLFVDVGFQTRGLGRQLFEAVRIAGGWHWMTVDAAPVSAHIYAALGFKATGPEVISQGITTVPMLWAPVETPAA